MIAFAEALPSTQALPEYISPSAAKSYLSCSLKFYFERVVQIPAPTTPALHLGKAVHAALQAFHLARWRGDQDTPESVAAAFHHSFNELERKEGPVKWKDVTTRIARSPTKQVYECLALTSTPMRY